MTLAPNQQAGKKPRKRRTHRYVESPMTESEVQECAVADRYLVRLKAVWCEGFKDEEDAEIALWGIWTAHKNAGVTKTRRAFFAAMDYLRANGARIVHHKINGQVVRYGVTV